MIFFFQKIPRKTNGNNAYNNRAVSSKKYRDKLKEDNEKYEDYKRKRKEQQRKRRKHDKPSSIGRASYSKKYSEKNKDKRNEQQKIRRAVNRPSSTGRASYSKKYSENNKNKRKDQQKIRRAVNKPSSSGRGKYSKKYMEQVKSDSARWDKHRQSKTRQQRKRRIDTLQEIQDEQNKWPVIPSSKVKERCINEYRNAFSAKALERTICSICGEEHFGRNNMKIMDIDKIPNRHLLESITTISNVHKHENMIVEPKGLVSSGRANICNKCSNYLYRNILPPCSLANMPLTSQPDCFQILTLPEKVLIAMYRMKVILLKLKPFKTGSHMAIKGNTISYPQNITSITKQIVEIPISLNELTDVIRIIFIGKTMPSKKHLKNILTVRRNVVLNALEFLKAHHYMYKDIPISYKNIRSLPKNDVPTPLFKSISVCNKNDSDDEEELLNAQYTQEPITLQHTGIVDLDGMEISEHEKKCAAMEKGGPIVAIPHGMLPVNEYNNTELWLGAFSYLFPYGIGGPTTLDGKRVTLKTFLRHLLNFNHHHYRKEHMFVLAMYNVIHKQEVCLQTSLTIRRPLFSYAYTESIDSVKSKELKRALLNKQDFNQLSPQVQTLFKQLHAVGNRIPGSAYAKKGMRKEIHAQMVSESISNFSDLSKYVVSDYLHWVLILTLFSRPKNNPVNVDVGYFWTPNSMQYTENFTGEIQILMPVWCQLSPEVSKMVSYMKYMEYQEKRAFHCLHARPNIPSGVQKYPKTTKWI